MSPKTAEEWREYRRINRERINENKKRRRLENKESEKLRLMKPLISETAARPAKSEQQSIKACEDLDTFSVAQSKPAPPAEKVEQEPEYAMASGISFQAQVARQPSLWVVPQPVITRQDSAREEQEPGEQRFRELHKGRNYEIVKKEQFARLIGERTKRSFLTYFFSLCITIFLCFNTAFLVLEQSSLYVSLGYSGAIALMIAVLTESALILFSTMASWTPGWIWKAGLYGGCLGTGFVIFSLLNVSVENRAAGKVRNSEQAAMLKKEIKTQEALEGTALAIIGNLDASVYPTRISRLKSQLNNPGPEGHTHRLGVLREKLARLSASGNIAAEVRVLQWQRWASIGWNVLLAGFLGYLWRRKFSVLEFS